MIESLFEELTSKQPEKSGDRDEFSDSPDQEYSENAFLSALPVVQIIVKSKVLSSVQSDTSDLVQSIALRLWKWRDKYRNESEGMSFDEWQSFAARTAYNEINRHYSTKSIMQVPLETATGVVGQKSAEGQTDAEVFSLIKSVWQEICCLSLRQRRALLFHSLELVLLILQSGISDKKIAQLLEIPESEWADVKTLIPLSDFQIAELISECESKKCIDLLSKSIKKARHEARNRLNKLKK